MLKQNIKVNVLTSVGGPNGKKLKVGEHYDLEDNAYTRLLIKSGTVELIDPPSLDPEFLEKGDYELREGYSYEELKKASSEKKAAEESKKAGKIKKRVEPAPGPDTYLTRTTKPKASDKVEPIKADSEEVERTAYGLKSSTEPEVEAGEEGHPEARGEESEPRQMGANQPEVESGEEGHPEARGEEPAAE